MKITDVHIDGFGVWNELSVDSLADGVTLFFGRNEAGKTTLMQFVRAVLYGFSPERRKLYLPPVYGGVTGGLLRVENHSGQYVVERRVSDRDENSPGRVVVLGSNGSRQGQHLLNILLSGVDESIFQNVFAVGIRELQELATLNDTQAAELLYNLTSGVDRVSLVDVMRGLESSRQQILPADQTAGEIRQLIDQRDALTAEVAELDSRTRHWVDLSSERVALTQEVTQLENKIGQLKHDSRTVEIALQVRDMWISRDEVAAEYTECGHVEELPDECVERLDGINEQVEVQKEHLQPLKQRRLQIRRELAAQPINRALWEGRPRIEAICEHGPWIESLNGQIRELREETESSEMDLLRHEELLAAEGGATLAAAPVVLSRTVQQLQPAALALREAVKRRALARKQQRKTRQEEEHAVEELESELAGRDADNMDDALHRAGELVSQLRRRVKLEDRLEQMSRQQDELEQEHHELLDSQLQRVRLLVGVGAMFVFGSVLILTGLFGWQVMTMATEVRWGVGFLGMICVGLASAWKTVLERTAQDELNSCMRRRESLEREVEEALDDRDQLNKELPAGSGTFNHRLGVAERELQELETKVPLYQERVDARCRIHDARRQATSVEEESREARTRWRRALRHAGLPETLTPKQVRQLGAHHQKKAKIDERLGRQRQRLEKLESDRDALVLRLHQLHEDIGIEAVSEDPQIQLSQLAAALSGQREMAQRRRQLQTEERDLRRQMTDDLQRLRRLRRGREALFAEARVTDEEELRERVRQLQRAATLREQLESLTRQIQTVVGDHCPEEDIEGEIVDHSAETLKRRWDDLTARLRDAQAHLAQVHQRRGEINHEMKSLSEDRRMAAARFELECVRQKLVDAARRWRELTMTWHLLESIRETYEAERQPETLDEASLYLSKLTEGKYTRVWTPLGRNELRVDDQEGSPLPLDVLSRGTREAVFLALRLALVASYGRRGIRIPMVLDDVLVNLDAQRAEAAVGALCEFACDGRQLLFFTCHDHIRAMFERARVDIRVLPGHGTPGVRVTSLDLPTLEVEEEPEEEEIFAEAYEEAEEELAAEEEEVEVDEFEDAEAEADEEEYEEEEYEYEEEEEEVELELEETEPEELDQPLETAPTQDLVLADAVERGAYTSAIDLADYEPDDEVAEDQSVIEEPVEEIIEEEPVVEPVVEIEEIEPSVDDYEDDVVSVEPIDHVFSEIEHESEDDGLWWDAVGNWPAREEETAA